jgi:hypothetical protein
VRREAANRVTLSVGIRDGAVQLVSILGGVTSTRGVRGAIGLPCASRAWPHTHCGTSRGATQGPILCRPVPNPNTIRNFSTAVGHRVPAARRLREPLLVSHPTP